jgi:hypothetical protein
MGAPDGTLALLKAMAAPAWITLLVVGVGGLLLAGSDIIVVALLTPLDVVMICAC